MNKKMGKSSLYRRLAFSNIKNNRRIYVPYMLSALGTIMMFYIICALPESIDAEALFGGRTVQAFLSVGTNVIAVFAVIFLFYTNSFIIKRRKKELGLYNILGLEKKHIARIILLETFITAFVSLAVGLLLGIIFNKLMFMLLMKIMAVELAVSFTLSTKALIMTLVLFAVIFVITLLYNLIQILKAKPIELLHGGAVGEKEPKANWFVALLGIALLGVGYYISVTIQSPAEAIILFFLAVILVILGTYCLFVSGMTALLKILKRKKNYYYKSRHFTTISGMLYRMKQNAAGLATICILSTCVLVMISTTFSMYTSIESIVDARYPRGVSFAVGGIHGGIVDEALDWSEEMIDEEIANLGLTSENMHSQVSSFMPAAEEGNKFDSSVDYSTATYLYFITESTYTKNAGKVLDLADDEVAIQLVNTEEKHDTILFGDREFKARYIDDYPSTGDENIYLGNNYLIFVKDMDIASEIVDELQLGGWGRTFSIDFTCTFDLAGASDSEKEALIVNMRERVSRYEMEMVPEIERINEAAGDEDAQTYVFGYSHIANSDVERAEMYQMYGSFFFLGIFLGLMFIMALVLIIYYKQVTEGYEDKRRFEIMQNVGMSHAEVKRSIHSQILLVFFLPLLVAFIHLAFAMPILIKILSMMYLTDMAVIIMSTIGVSLVFALIYTLVYLLTARTYYKIVEA